MKLLRFIIVLGSLCLFGLAGCATIDPQTGERNDPLEKFNRTMWDFNYHIADPYLLKPLAITWKEYVPSPIKTGLINVANNLDEPAAFVNRLLEGNIKKAFVHFHRFWINSIFGLGGLIDWASYSTPLKLQEERRFGHTLGHYGVKTGSYVMLPFYGAATPRQDLGNLVDTTYPLYSLLGPWTLLKSGLQSLNTRANLIAQESILEQSQDAYITFREAYFQHLDFQVKNGESTPIEETLSPEELDLID